MDIPVKPSLTPAINSETPGSPTSKAQAIAIAFDYSGLRALIERKVGDPHLAADLLQEAALTALDKFKRGAIDRPDQLSGYIYRVALNHLRNYRRKDRSQISCTDGVEMLADESSCKGDDVVLREQWATAANHLLRQLPNKRDREILIRFYLDEHEKDDICKNLGVTEAHFHRVIFRARERFKVLLERAGISKHDLLSIVVAVICAGPLIFASAETGAIVSGFRQTEATLSTGSHHGNYLGFFDRERR